MDLFASSMEGKNGRGSESIAVTHRSTTIAAAFRPLDPPQSYLQSHRRHLAAFLSLARCQRPSVLSVSSRAQIRRTSSTYTHEEKDAEQVA